MLSSWIRSPARPTHRCTWRNRPPRRTSPRVLPSPGLPAMCSPASSSVGRRRGVQASCRLRVLGRAMRYRGVREHPPGSNRGPEIDRWCRWANGLTGYPWCAAFMCGMVREACGLVVPTPKRASVGFLEAWAAEVGGLLKPVTRPRRGDWIVYRWDADDWPDHIGAVLRVIGVRKWRGGYFFGTVRTIEGNVDDAVRVKYRS